MRQSARYAILSGRRLTGSCRLPHEITGRKLGRQAAKAVPLATPTLPAAPGEWICAGYTGEGMVHAWLCAKAMARMLLGTEGEDRADPKGGESKFERLPDAYRFSMKRWKAAKMGDRLGKD